MPPVTEVNGLTYTAVASTAEAALASTCVNSNQVCFQWGTPEAAITSGSGNVYFQLRAPTTYSWFALGSGSAMQGASIFVIYSNGDNNVTLSTRSGQGNFMPAFTARSDVELLEGSGIVDGNMVANVRCNGCSDIDISSSSRWISAWKMGSPLDSANPSTDITVHDGHSQFSVNLQQASISSDSNPFLSTSSNGGTGNGSNSTSGVVVQQGSSPNQILQHAHGVVMAVVFIAGYPIGSSLMPLIGKWMLHASWQLLAFFGMWAGFGIGYTVSTRNGVFFKDNHTKLGVIVCALMGLQPILGWLHHQQFVKTQSRGIFSHFHIWFGRALMILGIVNGGLGLQATNQSTRFIIAYSVLAAVVSIIYTTSLTVGIYNRRNQTEEKRVASSSIVGAVRQEDARLANRLKGPALC
ncbi:hypothetical protein E4U19_006369 [Claviceps sp. Clav32 group G5]|nr:hypothetical protein E4U19_006369 [Claviceps sp. Clav32 group G5]KAG6043894.1 hypothetical protein E4U39_004024 [Claviceps sp. Clav50 group G5]